MLKLKYKNDNNELVEVEIRENRRIEVIDSNDNHYEMRSNKFGGIEVMASDGSISIEPMVSNHIVIKTNK